MPTAQDDRLFGRILVHLGLVAAEQVDGALTAAGEGRPLGTVLLERGAIVPESIVRAFSESGATLKICGPCARVFAPADTAVCPDCGATLFAPDLSGMLRDHLASAPCPPPATMLRPPDADFGASPAMAETIARDRTPDAPDATVIGGPRPAASGPAAAEPAAGTPFGRYRLLARLGAGGMGVVWKAWDDGLQRIVALKQIRGEEAGDDAGVTRFLREARLAAKLRHPGILAVHDVGAQDGKHFITMDYVEGRTFAACLDETRAAKRAGSAGGFERLRHEIGILAEVAAAVAAAHAQGVIHRDLKPANVLLDAQDRPYVMDFGLAKEFADASETEEGRRRTRDLTVSGQILGTPVYMSPEQAQGAVGRIGPSADVWALGGMLYELLTGETPFERAGSPWDVLRAVLQDEPVRPRTRNAHVPDELEAVCLRALEKERDRRIATAAEFGAELGRWLRGEPVEARRPGPAYRAWRWAWRRRKATLSASAALLLIAGMAVAGWRSREAESEAKTKAEQASREMLDQVRADVLKFEDSLMRLEMSPAVRAQMAEQSLGIIERLVQSDPRFGPAYSWRGQVKHLLGRDVEAEADFARGLERSPGHAAVWYLRGMYRIERYARSRALPGGHLSTNRIEFAAPIEETTQEKSWREGGLADLAAMAKAQAQDSRLGEEEFHLGCAAAAVHAREYDAALRDLEGIERPQAWKIRGLALYYLKRFDSAVEALGKACAAWPCDTGISLIHGNALYCSSLMRSGVGQDAREGFRRSIAILDALLAHHPEGVVVTCTRGSVLQALGDAEAARGEDPSASLGKAIADFTAALGRNPGLIQALIARGISYQSLGDAEAARGLDPRPNYDRGIADCEAALARNPNYVEGYAVRGVAYGRIGEAEFKLGADPRDSYRRAIGDCDAVVSRSPDFADSYNNRGMVYRLLGEAQSTFDEDPRESFRRALEDFGANLARIPEGSSALNNRGVVYLRLGEDEAARGQDPHESYGKAMADFDAALARNDANVEAHLNRGNLHRDLGNAEGARDGDPRDNYRKALDDYAAALKLHPAYAPALLNRGHAHAALGDAEAKRSLDPRDSYRHAIADQTAAMAQDPALVPAIFSRGMANASLAQAEAKLGLDPRDDYRRAVEDFSAGLARNPASADMWNRRGTVRVELGKLEAAHDGDPRDLYRLAIEDFNGLLARQPESATARCNRGIATLGLGEAEEQRGADAGKIISDAESDFRAAIAHGVPSANFQLARIMQMRGRYVDALAALEAGAREAPDQAAAAAKCIEETRRLQAAAPGWSVEFDYAMVAVEARNYPAARVRLEKGLALFEQDAARLSAEDRTTFLANRGVRANLTLAHYDYACILSLASTGRAAPDAEPKAIAADEAARLRDQALQHLAESVRFGWADRDHLLTDTDLEALHSDPRWTTLVGEQKK